ncbi:MAG: hypothetical protein R2741_01290 [Methanolobus sp.]
MIIGLRTVTCSEPAYSIHRVFDGTKVPIIVDDGGHGAAEATGTIFTDSFCR